MAVSYFKNVYSYLTSMYPERKVFVISDHHFYHSNIVLYERNEFLDVADMHDFTIKRHNEVVGNDDVVIFLGDFCFKNSAIKDLNDKMNGHKFLLLGNHDDSKQYLKRYREYGFENVFMYPIKFNDSYLSHYPILGEHPNEVLYTLLENEFKKQNGTNMYGHEHNGKNKYDNSVNVTLENQDFYPKYIGNTGKKLDDYKSEFIIDNKEFKEVLDFFINDKNMSEEKLISDFIYTMMIEATGAYTSDIFFSGSYTLFKKYGYKGPVSDLDASLINDPTKGNRTNYSNLKKCVDGVFSALNNFPGFNLSFEKRMSNINILKSLYTNGNGKIIQNYLDMNITPDYIYKPSDFINYQGSTTIEKLCRKYYPQLLHEYYFPQYQTRFLTSTSDIANLVLQYLYQVGYPEKKKIILSKLSCIMKNMPESDHSDLTNLENTLIRYFIRNILFFYHTRRMDEINAIREINPNLIKIKDNIPKCLYNILENIFYNSESDFNIALRELMKANSKEIEDCSKEIIRSRSL